MSDRPEKPETEPRKRFGIGDLLFLAGFAAVCYFGGGIVLGFFSGDPTSFGPPRPITLSDAVENEKDPHLADLRALTEIVRQRWSYLEYRQRVSGVDLAELEAEALAAVRKVEGEAARDLAFRQAVTAYVSALGDGHSVVIFEDFRLPTEWRHPFGLVEVAEGLMVERVHPSASDSVQRGDLLLAIGGKPIAAVIAEAERQVFASTPGSRRRRAIEYLARWASTAETSYELRRGEERVVVELSCPPSHAELPADAPTFVQRQQQREVRLLEDRIAYFRPGSFASPPGSDFASATPERREEILASGYAEFDEIIAGFAETNALILDLRANPGGTDLLGQHLVSMLLEPGFTYFQLAGLAADGWHEPLSQPCEVKTDTKLRCRVVCMVDELTFSTADNVATCLRELHPDIQFVGRPNGAGTGAPRPFELPRTGTRVFFCTQRVYSPKGRIIEGRSVTLDRPVTWTREHVLTGHDPDLAAALSLARM